ncbi:hypothetical protein D3C87_1501550 [compost metagenome]
MRADLPGRWFSALKAPFEYAHGVGHAGFDFTVMLVHFVSCRGAAQMSQAGAADQAMGRVFMVQRRQDLALLQQRRVIRSRFGAAQGDFLLQIALRTNRRECQFTSAAGIAHQQNLRPGDHADLTLALSVFKLNQVHGVPPISQPNAARKRRLKVIR